MNTHTYYEQPNVRHLNEILVYLQTDKKTYGIGSTKNIQALLDDPRDSSSGIAPEFTVSVAMLKQP